MKLLLLVLLVLLTSCAAMSPRPIKRRPAIKVVKPVERSLTQRKMDCIERYLKMDIELTKAHAVCKDIFSRK